MQQLFTVQSYGEMLKIPDTGKDLLVTAGFLLEDGSHPNCRYLDLQQTHMTVIHVP